MSEYEHEMSLGYNHENSAIEEAEAHLYNEREVAEAKHQHEATESSPYSSSDFALPKKKTNTDFHPGNLHRSPSAN